MADELIEVEELELVVDEFVLVFVVDVFFSVTKYAAAPPMMIITAITTATMAVLPIPRLISSCLRLLIYALETRKCVENELFEHF